MAGAAAVDPGDGGGGVGHDGDRDNVVVVFGGEVVVAGFDKRQAGSVEKGFGSGIDAQFNAFLMQGFGQAGELPGGFLMDEGFSAALQTLGRWVLELTTMASAWRGSAAVST